MNYFQLERACWDNKDLFEWVLNYDYGNGSWEGFSTELEGVFTIQVSQAAFETLARRIQCNQSTKDGALAVLSTSFGPCQIRWPRCPEELRNE